MPYTVDNPSPVPLSLSSYLLGWTVNQYYALLFRDKFPERVHIVRLEDELNDPQATLGSVCEKLGLEPSKSLKSPTWNGSELEEVYPWGTIRSATLEANRATAEELSPDERAEVRARAWQYLEVFDYKGFI